MLELCPSKCTFFWAGNYSIPACLMKDEVDVEALKWEALRGECVLLEEVLKT